MSCTGRLSRDDAERRLKCIAEEIHGLLENFPGCFVDMHVSNAYGLSMSIFMANSEKYLNEQEEMFYIESRDYVDKGEWKEVKKCE